MAVRVAASMKWKIKQRPKRNRRHQPSETLGGVFGPAGRDVAEHAVAATGTGQRDLTSASADKRNLVEIRRCPRSQYCVIVPSLKPALRLRADVALINEFPPVWLLRHCAEGLRLLYVSMALGASPERRGQRGLL